MTPQPESLQAVVAEMRAESNVHTISAAHERTLQRVAAFADRIEAASQSGRGDGGALPELPPSLDTVRGMVRGERDWVEPCDDYYTAEQMRAYARAALATLATPTPEASAGVEERARELLAAECAECGGEGGYMAAGGDEGGVWHNCGTCRDGERLGSVNRHQALTAIAAALAAQAREG